MSTKVTTVDIIEYLSEIDSRKKELPKEDDGFRTSKQIAQDLGIGIRKARQILNEIQESGFLVSEYRPRKVLGNTTNRILVHKIKDGTKIDDYFKG